MFNQLIKFSNTCYNLIKLNLFWWMGLIFGGIIFGLYPSSIVLFQLVNRFVQGYEVTLKDFFRAYFQIFKSANRQNFPTLILILVLLTERLVVNNELLKSDY
ncbi:hypothetical protein RyT2_19400 [Pseudolactococcus yaeyamensis]